MTSNIRSAAVSALAALAVVGCAVPNTPGAGTGDRYTPVIDMQGVDSGRYSSDLDACRRLAQQVGANNEVAWGAIGGAIVGGLIGSSYGLTGRNLDSVATTGAYAGMGSAANKAVGRQERIMGSCMASRGYVVLDGTAAPGSYRPAAASAPAATASIAPTSPTTTLQSPGDPPKPLTLAVGETMPAGPQRVEGKWAYEAEHTPEAKACSSRPSATLVARSASAETYSVPCSNGEFLSVRCENLGGCRALR